MENITVKQSGTTLTLTIDLSKDMGRDSKTGASLLVASSGGNKPIPGFPELRCNVLVYKPHEAV